MNWTLPGGLLFTSITADRINNFNLDNDDDAGPITLTHSHFIDKSAMFSQEFRLTSKQGGPYDYVAGLYYLDENVRANRHTAVVPAPDENFGIVDAAKVGTRSYAGFGNLNYHFAPAWTLGVGLRYTIDRKDRTSSSRSMCRWASSPLRDSTGVRRSDKQVSGDLTLTWKPAQDLLSYGTYAKASRAAASRPTSSTSATWSPSASSPKPR